MKNHNFLNSLNDRRKQNSNQLASTIEDLLQQVENLRQQLKRSQDEAQRESGAEGIAKEAAKAVARATKMLEVTYGTEGVQLFQSHLLEIINNPDSFDSDWNPQGEVEELPQLPEDLPEPPDNNSDLQTKATAEDSSSEAIVEVEASIVPENVPEDSGGISGTTYDFSVFKNLKELKAFAVDYLDVRRKNRGQIEQDLAKELEELGITQSQIDQ